MPMSSGCSSATVRPHSPSARRRAPTPARYVSTASIGILRTLSTGMRSIRLLIATALAALVLPAAAHAGTLALQNGVISYTETDTSAKNVLAIATSSDGTRVTVSDTGHSGRAAVALKTDGSCTVKGST